MFDFMSVHGLFHQSIPSFLYVFSHLSILPFNSLKPKPIQGTYVQQQLLLCVFNYPPVLAFCCLDPKSNLLSVEKIKNSKAFEGCILSQLLTYLESYRLEAQIFAINFSCKSRLRLSLNTCVKNMFCIFLMAYFIFFKII
jgi:hypothetical protein